MNFYDKLILKLEDWKNWNEYIDLEVVPFIRNLILSKRGKISIREVCKTVNEFQNKIKFSFNEIRLILNTNLGLEYRK